MIIALLAWYEEEPGWLDAALRSLHRTRCLRHIVAFDGAYALYPDAQPRSDIAQHEAITRAAHHLDVGLTIHIPQDPWESEIAKRTAMFATGDQIARAGDWYIVIDGDERITHTPNDLAERLDHSTFDVADVTINEPKPDGYLHRYPLPMLFRAIPGITVRTNHYTYVTPDGRLLWGNAATERLEPRLDLTSTFVVDHLTHFRDQARRDAAKGYYRHRDKTLVEAGVCVRCTQPATRQVPIRWRHVGDGYAASWCEACDHHADELLAEATTFLKAHGLALSQAISRPGPIPAGVH